MREWNVYEMNETMITTPAPIYRNERFRINAKSEQIMNEEAFKRWDRLLDSYFDDPIFPEEWYASVQRLFADEVFEEEKSAAMEKHFNRMVQYDPNPDDDVISRLEKIKTELGFYRQERRTVYD